MNIYGCCFAYSGDNVLLIRKAKPDWQKGLLNGIGGKIEAVDYGTDEQPASYVSSIINCTSREFYEETGCPLPRNPHIFYSALWPDYLTHKDWPLVYFSGIEMSMADLMEIVQGTVSNAEPCTLRKLSKVENWKHEAIDNLPFILEMMKHMVICTPEQRKLRQPIVPSWAFWEEGINQGLVGKGQ